jgi:hypothetical protein
MGAPIRGSVDTGYFPTNEVVVVLPAEPVMPMVWQGNLREYLQII